MKFVKQDRTQTVDSLRMALRDSARRDSFVQGRTWQPDISGRSRQFVGFMCRRTFESPINVKQRGNDIVRND